MVRQAIEGINYVGGSTLTARALRLALAEFGQRRRAEATQAIVLFGDGISQDQWEEVGGD